MNLLYMPGPYVIKLGGSLETQIDPILGVLRSSPCPSVVVPGGGRFAEEVRRTGITGEAAHWMAIAAMEQFGWYIVSRGIPHCSVLRRPKAPELLLPYLPLRLADPLSHSWDVTSDTIAAWVAYTLDLDLIVLKSVDGIFSGGVSREEVDRVIETETVDPCFLPFVLDKGIRTKIINGNAPERLELFLKGYFVPGTTIGF
jgi:aspartokinase-like uncharacterized kinase